MGSSPLHWAELPVRSPSQPRNKKVRGWARRGVRRAGVTQLRREHARTKAEEQCAARRPASSGQTPLDELLQREAEQRGQALRRAIDAILEEHATGRMARVLQLRLEGKTNRQVAAELGVSVETVKLDRRKVANLLREELPRLGWSLP